MPATKTNEMAFNVHLFNVLRTKHPRWRDHAGVEQTGVFRDNTRQALDRAVLIDLLQLSKDALEPLAILRDQWCAEPSVHGGKKTRIGV